jgi:chromosome segregation ATPase
MKIEISNGELLDKRSILEIKAEKIHLPEKLENIRKELELVKDLSAALFPKVSGLYDQLKETNLKLWAIEDLLRDYESKKEFGEEFIQAARSVYLLNDRRSEIKRQINLATGSEIREEKSYTPY